MIDAFIIRSYKDEAHEVAQGLAMGLKDANGKKKTAYNVFKNMDSSNSLKYTEKVLKSQVGNWKSLVRDIVPEKFPPCIESDVTDRQDCFKNCCHIGNV